MYIFRECGKYIKMLAKSGKPEAVLKKRMNCCFFISAIAFLFKTIAFFI